MMISGSIDMVSLQAKKSSLVAKWFAIGSSVFMDALRMLKFSGDKRLNREPFDLLGIIYLLCLFDKS